jgi:hypothetical protein
MVDKLVKPGATTIDQMRGSRADVSVDSPTARMAGAVGDALGCALSVANMAALAGEAAAAPETLGASLVPAYAQGTEAIIGFPDCINLASDFLSPEFSKAVHTTTALADLRVLWMTVAMSALGWPIERQVVVDKIGIGIFALASTVRDARDFLGVSKLDADEQLREKLQAFGSLVKDEFDKIDGATAASELPSKLPKLERPDFPRESGSSLRKPGLETGAGLDSRSDLKVPPLKAPEL